MRSVPRKALIWRAEVRSDCRSADIETYGEKGDDKAIAIEGSHRERLAEMLLGEKKAYGQHLGALGHADVIHMVERTQFSG